MNWQASFPSAGRVAAAVAIGLAVLLVMGLALIPMASVGGGSHVLLGRGRLPGRGGGRPPSRR